MRGAITIVAVAALAVAALQLAGSPRSLAGSPGESEDADFTYNVTNAIRFREGIGFDSSESFVVATFADPNTYSNLEWGVPLSEAEASKIDRRRAIAESSRPAIRYAEEQPGYAGMMFDRDDRWMPVFWFKNHIADHEREISRLISSDVDFRILRADLSMDELRDIQAEITRDALELRQLGIEVASVGFDRPANSVQVSVTSDPGPAVEVLRQRYGGAVTAIASLPLEQDACTGATSCGNRTGSPEQWKGGLKIHAVGQASTAYCTSGMVGRKSGNVIMVTAGHCFRASNGGLGNWWEHGSAADPNDKIGKALQTTWVQGSSSSSDIGWLDIVEPWNTTPKNEMFVAGGQRSMSGLKSNYGQQVNDYICRSAFKSGYACGWIIDRQVNNINVDGGTVDFLWKVDFDAIGGDSGGPYFIANDYYGIHNDSTLADYPADGHSYYTTVDRIQSQTGIDICITAAC